MNNTELVKTNGQASATINSREVADMTGVEHKELLKKLRKYATILNGGNFALVEFFIESTYVDSKGQERPCYELTKKGCEMVANKMTGEKGVLFTAAYVDRFNKMEKEIALQQFNLPTTYKEALLALVAAEEEKERLIAENNKKQELLVAQAPMIDLYNDFVSQHHIYSITEIAKCLAIKDLGRNNLHKWLRWNKILIGQTYEAYQKYVNAGYIVHRVIPFEIPKYKKVDGKKVVTETKTGQETKAYFTVKGIEWLYKRLIKDGYIISKTLQEVLKEITPEETTKK